MSRLSGGASVMSRPPMRTAPAATGTKPDTQRSSVVFPQPEEPSSATNSPGATSSDTPLSTRVPE